MGCKVLNATKVRGGSAKADFFHKSGLPIAPLLAVHAKYIVA